MPNIWLCLGFKSRANNKEIAINYLMVYNSVIKQRIRVKMPIKKKDNTAKPLNPKEVNPTINQSLGTIPQAKPPQYVNDIYIDLINEVANGANIIALTRSERYPTFQAFFAYLSKNPEIAVLYEQAKQMKSHYLIEETILIADSCDDNVPKAVLQNKTRQHYAAKVNPQEYGDSSTLRLADNDGNKLTLSTIIDQID